MIENNQRFHVGLKAFIRKGDKLLILRESKKFQDGGKWELPGGRIMPKEAKFSLEKVLLREVKEECGKGFNVNVGPVIGVWRRMTHPDFPVFLVGFACKYNKGQVQLSDEHIELAWITEAEMGKYKFVEGYRKTIKKYFKK